MDRLESQTTHGTTGAYPHSGQGAVPGATPAQGVPGATTSGTSYDSTTNTPSYTPGRSSGAFDPWRYRDDARVAGVDLTGYKIEATDGSIGKIDHASHEVDSSFLVVDTGPWIFGRKVMLPAGVVNHVDHDEQRVYVDRSKDQIKAAPEYDETLHTDPSYRDKLGGYYDDTYSAVPPGTTDGTPPNPMR